MIEVTTHEAYAALRGAFDRVGLDYVILRADGEAWGIEAHKKAAASAFSVLNGRFSEFDYRVSLDPDAMTAEKSDLAALLWVPEDYDERKKRKHGAFTISSPLPYWYAFLEPPHGTPYLASDFAKFHDILFPNKENVEVYRWNDDFSDYFDDGKEWWGTGFWTVYDAENGLFVVIGASLTD